jgi:hypothetical protein
MFSGLSAGRAAVRFSISTSIRRPCNPSRMLRQKASSSMTRSRRTTGAVSTAAAQRASRHSANPASHAPSDTPHSATDGQPSLNSHPVSARISAMACAAAAAVRDTSGHRKLLHAPRARGTPLKMVGQRQRDRVESRPVAAPGHERKPNPMIDEIIPAVQQHDSGPLLPARLATVEPAINDIVLREPPRTRRGKPKTPRFAGIPFHPRRLRFCRNKIRPGQELPRLLQARILAIGPRHSRGRELNGRPIQQFGQRRDQTLTFNAEPRTRQLNPALGSALVAKRL